MRGEHVSMSSCAHVVMGMSADQFLRGIALACASVLAVTGSYAQSTGKIRLFIEPGHNYQFVLDDKYRMQQREVELMEGPHRFSFWAPSYRVVDTTLTVVPNTVTTFTMRLPLSNEYLAWQREVATFRRQVVISRALPAAASVGLAAWSMVSFFKHRTAHQQLQDDELLYSSLTSPRAIQELKDETLPASKEELKNTRTMFTISTGLFALAAAGTAYAFIRTRGRQMPMFEDKEKIKFDGLVFVPSRDGNVWAAGITIPLR